MMPVMKMCSNRLLMTLDDQIEHELDMSLYFRLSTLDSICNCTLSMDLDCLNNQSDSFFLNVTRYFDQLSSYKMINLLPSASEIRCFVINLVD